ncbi:MAG TPA: hypothetical protein VM934_00105 [Pyrinomonadaceae bacterium]|nr:hypothetical protein [Pyrinomonadaceae bacterium]
MGELGERLWAVISERGCEATQLDYAAAAELSRRLRSEKVSGLCVVTATAAGHLQASKPADEKSSSEEFSSNTASKRTPRAPKK